MDFLSKKHTRSIFSFLLLFSLFFSFFAISSSTKAESPSKISTELEKIIISDEFRNSPLSKIPTMVWFYDEVDNEKALQLAENDIGLSMNELLSYKPLISEDNYAYLKSIEDEDYYEKELSSCIDDSAKKLAEENSLLMNELIHKKRHYSAGMYSVQNRLLLESVGLTTEQCEYISRYSPSIMIDLTPGEIQKLASCDNIEMIYYLDKYNTDIEAKTVSDFVADAYGDYTKNTLGWTGSGVKIGILELAHISSSSHISNLHYTEPFSSNFESDKINHANNVGAIIAGANGFAPDAIVYSTYLSDSSPYYEALERLIDCGVSIINASLKCGTVTGDYGAADKWCDHITSQHNITFIKSAGNKSGSPELRITPPGMAYNAITVGSHNGCRYDYDLKNFSSAFSCYVETSGRAEKPDIVACGYQLLNIGTSNGTSFSAASVTGVLAQLMQGNAALKAKPTLAKAIICAGARKWCNDANLCSSHVAIHSFSEQEGAGQLRAKTAASILSSGRYYYTSGGTSSSNDITRTVNVSSSDAIIKVCLTWEKRNKYSDNHETDDIYEQPTLANWNLVITSPSGEHVYKSQSMYNNVELVCFEPEEIGTYTITIKKVNGYASNEYLSVAWY